MALSIYGCEYERLEPPIDCASENLGLELVSVVQDANCGLTDGAFEVVATGGDGVYEYSIGDGFQTSGAFSNLAAGTYSVTVSDGNACTTSLFVPVQNQDGINISVATRDAGCGTENGQITISATGGEMPYSFRLNGGNSISSGLFDGLAGGEYEILAVDNSGCEVTQTITILSGISYQSSVSSIIQTNCAVSGCHAGSISPDLRSFDNIQQYADRIKARTGAQTMPPSGALPQSEIDAIACWVEDGALDN